MTATAVAQKNSATLSEVTLLTAEVTSNRHKTVLLASWAIAILRQIPEFPLKRRALSASAPSFLRRVGEDQEALKRCLDF